MTDKELETVGSEEFWTEVEGFEAERLEITVDYYLAEFYCT